MHKKTLVELIIGLRNREFSSLDLTKNFIERIKKHDGSINSFITVTEELAIDQAKEADILIAKGKAKALTGIPMAQKDLLCIKGLRTSCASRVLENFYPPYNATVIKRFAESGCVNIGKTNMDEFAMGSSNENSAYGLVKNPWSLNTVPGGSSGGSAAAVAARFVPVATGTDTGGSIRQPSALCGITGLKPTYGKVSRFGMVSFSSSLDQIGPMAKTAEDISIILDVISGKDRKDSTSFLRKISRNSRFSNKIQGSRIGLPVEYMEDNIDKVTAEFFNESIDAYKLMGAELVPISLPNIKHAISAYYITSSAECSSNLARFDGIKYGYRDIDYRDRKKDFYVHNRSEGFGDETKRRIMIGTYVLSSDQYNAYYERSQKIRKLIQNDYKKAFEKVDIIMSPISPTAAFKIHSRLHEPASMYLSDVYTVPINLAGLPAISLPMGFKKNTPIGMQLVGNFFEEDKILNFAHHYQKQTNWHLQSPF